MTPSQRKELSTSITEVSSSKGVPNLARCYAITKDCTVDQALAHYEKKYGVKPVTATKWGNYLYIPHEFDRISEKEMK